MDPLSLAEAVRDAVYGAVDSVEVLVERADQAGYMSENGPWIPTLEGDLWRVALRGLKGGRLAVASSSVPDPGLCAAALLRALPCAQPSPLGAFEAVRPVDDDRRGEDPSVSALVDRPSALRALAEALRARTLEARGGLAVSALETSVGAWRRERVVLTEAGAARSRASGLYAGVQINGDWGEDRAWTAMPLEESVTALGARYVASLPAREVTPEAFLGGAREVPVELSPRLLEALLRRLWTERLGLDRALAGHPVFAVGERAADEGVTLVDDPGARGSFKGAPTDDEGVQTGARAVLSEGVVRALLSDRRSAAEAGTVSTGNGFRVPFISEDRADAPVRVALGHLSMTPGATPREALVRGRALRVPALLGLHSANRATGAFNSPIIGGLALEDGRPVARLQPGAWSLQGNAFGLLRGLLGRSSEREHTGSAELPWVVAPLRAG
ncbi:MAG: hypothetical protein HY909_10340 [Deltaproteobacteria bacterium]|nr:hypothetical protein [Deltaproteobacteria bacterium]